MAMESLPRASTRFERLELSFGAFDAFEAVRFARRFPPHFHDTFAIGVVEEGSCVIRTQRGTWTAKPGSILAFSPGEMHAAIPCGEHGYGYRMIYPATQVMTAIGLRWRGRPIFRAPVIDDVGLATGLTGAQRRLMGGEGSSRSGSALADVLRDLAAKHVIGERDVARTATDAQAIARALEYMRARLDEPIRLQDIATECGVSSFQLIRIFRRSVGATPISYLIQMRITRAQGMLSAGKSVGETAYRCGFSDQSHLTRTFREVIGVSPGRYMRSIRPGNSRVA